MPASPGLSVECPTCQVAAGVPCYDRHGRVTRTHVARVKAEPTRPPGAPSSAAASPAEPVVALPTTSGSALDDVLQVLQQAWLDAMGREMTPADFDALRAVHSATHSAITQPDPSHSAVHSATHSAITQPDLSAESETVQLAYGHIRLQVLQNGGYPLVLTGANIAFAIGKSPRSVDTARNRLRQLGAIVCRDEGRSMLYGLPGGHEDPRPLTPSPITQLRNELRNEPTRARRPAGRERDY